MSLDAGRSHLERIEQAVLNTLAECEIAPSRVNVSIQRVEEAKSFEVRVALIEGAFVWSGRIREDRFDSDLRANIAALKVWL